MPRLFLALELPDSIKAYLLPLQDNLPAGSNLVPPANLHITLVFIGKAEPQKVSQALNHMKYPAVSISLEEPGCFKQRNGTHFWVGLKDNSGLLDLRQQLLSALQGTGLKPDDKPFRPHITLARCKGALSESARQPFLSQPLAASAISFQPPYFSLYSSETLPEGPIYHIVERFFLPPT